MESVQFNDVDFEIEYDPRRYSQVLTFTFRIKRDDIDIALGTPITGAQLGQLSDVNVSSLAEGQILKYDFSEGEWVNASLPILAIGSLTQSESNGYTVLNISQNPSFSSISSAADVTVGGDILLTGSSAKLIRPLDIGQSAGPLTIQSNGDLVIELDQDNNEPYKAFIVKNGGDAEVFRVTEEGNVTINQQYVLPSSDGGTDYFLKTDGSGQLYFATLYGTSGNTGGSPPPAIDTLVELLDTDISNLQDNQIIRYDTASGKWLNEDFQALPAGGTTGQALVKASGTDYDVQWADIAIDVQYHQRYDTEAGTLRSGATETVELYYTAQADGDGLSESASSDTPSAGNVIRRKLWYAEKAQADPDTSGDWAQFADIADDTAYATAKATLLAYLKERTGGTVPISLKMTWEDTAATSYLLDDYSGAAAAYSLRLLSSTYTGDAINVWNGTSYADIGFDGSGELDTTALAAHCGSNDGFIRYWYDQSGNSNDAAQTATGSMPKIYDGTTGVTLNSNSKPAVYFQDNVSNKMNVPTGYASDPYFITAVSEVPTGVTDGRSDIYSNGSGGNIPNGIRLVNWENNIVGLWNGDGSSMDQNNKTETATLDTTILITGYNVSGNMYIFRDGVAGSNNPVSTSISTTQTSGFIHGNRDTRPNYIAEIIIYDSDQSSNRSGIESNIATYHGITI